MHEFLSKLQRLLADFRRRRVFRVAAVYAVVAFVLLEVMDALFPALLLPDWADTLVAVLLIVGFPVAVILAWAYDITPEGVRRTPAGGEVAAPAPARTDASVMAAGPRTAAESIAVLPFVNLSGEPESEYLSDGITEELINALNQIEGLKVASRGTCFRFKGKTADAREVGAELGVDAILEGSVRRSGDRLRINVQLADAGDGFDIWSGSYDRQLTDIFELQDEISRSILDALCCELPGGDGAALVEAPTADVTAYEYYLRGRQFFHERRKKSLRFAKEMFEKAIEIDPEYALAHAAIELAPDLGQAHASRGFALYLMGRIEEAQGEFETAIRLDPKQFDARYFQARACYEQGDLERAARLFEEAAAAREDHEARYFAAQTYTALGRAEEAVAAYRRALPVIERHLELNPDDARAWTMGAVTHSRLSNRELGLEFAERAEEVDPEDAAVCYNVACLYALEGEADRAISCLEKASRAGFAHPEWIRQDPDLDSLRDDPRLHALLDED
jgi:TolB-like protein/Flp pilus assembly protein TadD